MSNRSGNNDELFRTLIIPRLPSVVTEKWLRSLFDRNKCIVSKCFEGGKCFGKVIFATETDADDCMANKPQTLNGRKMNIRWHLSNAALSTSGAYVQVKDIFISGIIEWFGITEDHLKEYFGKFGSIQTCWIPYDHINQRSRSFAFITFDNFDVVDKLVIRKHHTIKECVVTVKKDPLMVKLEQKMYADKFI